MQTDPFIYKKKNSESGNIVFLILLAIVLIALVTAALRSGGLDNANIDTEELTVKATQVRGYAGELERAVVFILTSGASELDLRFAHPDAPAEYGNDYNVTPTHQIFSPEGGGAEYRTPPAGVNDGSGWEFYARTALPEVGSANADLIAVLPNVTLAFCEKINQIGGYTGQPTDTGLGAANCLNAGAVYRFSNTDGIPGNGDDYDSTPNTTNEATFSVKPSMEGCVLCTDSGAYHFFHVLHVR